ncbi:MAG: valine--tRNA ligase, partial [Proteobacteria bacterium]|nr:valine--tRNA ligase [Pseudomonadota bacterium]
MKTEETPSAMDAEKAAAIYRSGQKAVVDLLRAQNELVLALRRNVEELEKANKDLEMKISRLSKNSSNSGKPPSSDDITKPKRDGKKNSGRKKGGQKGHPKHERPPFSEEELDKSENYEPHCCPECRSSDLIPLPDIEPGIVQQVELKETVVS